MKPIQKQAFKCPRCGSEWKSETADGAITTNPPVCNWGHKGTEMEQVYLGADAFKAGAA